MVDRAGAVTEARAVHPSKTLDPSEEAAGMLIDRRAVHP